MKKYEGSAYELNSELLVSPFITFIMLPYIIPYITPFNEFRPYTLNPDYGSEVVAIIIGYQLNFDAYNSYELTG